MIPARHDLDDGTPLRDAADPLRLTEVFLVSSWEEHLAQHERIDDAAASCLRSLRAFDREGRPTTVHLVAVDLERPEGWERLVAEHARRHGADGSIPMDPVPSEEG